MIRFLLGVVVGCAGAWVVLFRIALHQGGTVPPYPARAPWGDQ